MREAKNIDTDEIFGEHSVIKVNAAQQLLSVMQPSMPLVKNISHNI